MFDVIVVGLGAAGSMACAVLNHFNKHVLGLEADDRIGGRIHTELFGDSLVELGAEWIHGTKDNTVYNIALSHKINVKPQVLKHIAFTSDGQIENSTMLADLWQFAFSLVDNPTDVARPLGQFLTEKIEAYARAKFPELEQNPVYISRFLRWMNLIIGNHESCADWNEVTTQTEYKELEGSSHMSWHICGYKTLLEILIDNNRTPHVDVQLNCEVVQIKMPSEAGGPVEVTCTDGAVYHSRAVIVTVSLGVLKERHASLFDPPLPEEKVAAIEHLSIGVVNKVILQFDDMWWPAETFCIAFLWRSEDVADVIEEDMWTTKIFGASVTMANDKCLVFWASGEDAKHIETLPKSELQSKLMGILRRFMKNHFAIPEPVELIRSRWYGNPYTRGSYSYDNVRTPDYPNARENLAEPIYDNYGDLRLMFAGEATDRTHFSTVHGAVDSGRREASRFLKHQNPEIADDLVD